MQELFKKIRADAETRLTLPPGREAAQELARFKTFLKVGTHRLKMLHRAGTGGLEICQARSEILDLVLQHLWRVACGTLSEQARKEFPRLALVAIGGFGRGELNPHSDVDFMFLHHRQIAAGKPLPVFSKIIDGILYPLWDMGLKIGHSVRSVEDCVTVANSDMQSKTSLIESRLIIGDGELFDQFQKALLKKCVVGHEQEYIRMRLDDQSERRAKFGNSACMQEPNLKNGCGGLRDYQNLLWMIFFKYQTRSLQELQAHDMTTDLERKQLEAAYDFLLRVRTEMHYHVNRPVEVLSKALQPAVASNLGYHDRSPSRRIEVFMRDLYRHSRNIFLITRTLEQRLALLPEPTPRLSLRRLLPGRKPVTELVDGFKLVDGQIHAATPRVFREQPRRLMRVFLYAQQRGLQLHPDLASLIRNQLGLANRGFINDEHVRETFLTILNQRGDVAPVLRAMHEVGMLGKYIPEFGRLTCLVQHEFYHQYTADEHTLMCLEQLDRIWDAKEPPQQAYAQLFHALEKPYLLYLALLLHDTGKPEGHGNHAEVSGVLANRVARRLGLNGTDTHTLRLVIEQHLLMASLSQRRDLDDPAVIRNFAGQVQNTETLSMLTLLTFVDARATSDKLWNSFKDSLLWTLHQKAHRLMSGGAEFARAEEKQRELLKDEVHRLLPDTITKEEMEVHFTTLVPRYYQVHSAREVMEDLELAHAFMYRQICEEDGALVPLVKWIADVDRGFDRVRICTWDRAGLFVKIAGSFSAAGLTILSSRVFTRTDGIALDTFCVVDAKNGSLATPEQREQFEKTLTKVLGGSAVDFPALIARQKISRPVYQGYSGEQLPTRIQFDNDSSDRRTVIEVETEDRLGLLYTMSQAFTELELDISTAKIATEKGAAIDTFYVRDADGGKIVASERQKQIERGLRAALARLDSRLSGR
jgi:[protein-PII] uridylyltransferase